MRFEEKEPRGRGFEEQGKEIARALLFKRGKFYVLN